MSVSIDITSFIEKKFGEIQSCLREKGVSEEIIEAAFGCSDQDEPVAPLPTRRMLCSNVVVGTDALKAKEPEPNTTRATLFQSEPNKLTQNWFGKPDVVLVLNYTDKSHALFGDFVKTHASFRNDYLNVQSWLIFNKFLAFGAGWIVKDKTKAADLRKALKAAKIPFREVEKDVFVSELKETNNTVVAETSESTESEAKKPKKSEPEPVKPKTVEKTEVKPSKSTKEVEPVKPKGKVEPPPKKVEPKKAEADPSSKIKKNEWGNLADESGLVFKKLPIGEKGKTVAVIIGYQNPEPEGGESELESVLPLTIDHLEEAASKYSYGTLNDDVVKKVRKIDKDLADRLQDIQLRTMDDDLSDLDEADLEDLEDEDDDNLDDDDEEY